MVQTIFRKTYRCRLCKTIYTSLNAALDCEGDCLMKPYRRITKKKIIVKRKVRGPTKRYSLNYKKIRKGEKNG